MKSHDTICAHLVNTRGVSGNVLRPLGLNTPTRNHRFIVLLLKPIYARLGSPLLLQKCIEGYTQNANEALHSTVWKLCPKELFVGKESVDIACSIAVCRFNDGACALLSLSKGLNSLHFISVGMCSERETDCVCKNRNTSRVNAERRSGGVPERSERELKTGIKRGRGQCMCLGGLTVTQDRVNVLGPARDSICQMYCDLCVLFSGLFLKCSLFKFGAFL